MQSYRRVPVALEDAVGKKVEELLKQGIMEPVKGMYIEMSFSCCSYS